MKRYQIGNNTAFNKDDACIDSLKNSRQSGISATVLFNILSEEKNPSISFTFCGLNAQSLRSVFAALKKTPWVKHLDLSINALTDEALTVIGENLFNTSIESLSVEQNEFTSLGLANFCESLSKDERMSQIRSLTLKKNSISSGAWVGILNALKKYNLHLDVSLMLSIGDEVDSDLLKNAMINSEYLSLDLSFNFLNDASLQAVFAPIHKTMIFSLNISFNNATKEFLSKLPEMVKYSTLTEIRLYNQPIGLKNNTLLENVLENNKKISTLKSLGECFSRGRYLETQISSAPDEIVETCITFLSPRNKLEEKFIWMGYNKNKHEKSQLTLKINKV